MIVNAANRLLFDKSTTDAAEWMSEFFKQRVSFIFFFLKRYISNYAMGSSQFMERSEQSRVANTRMRVKLTSCAHGRDFFLASYP